MAVAGCARAAVVHVLVAGPVDHLPAVRRQDGGDHSAGGPLLPGLTSVDGVRPGHAG